MKTVVCLVFLLPLAYSLRCFTDITHNFQSPSNDAECNSKAEHCLSQNVAGIRTVYECDDHKNPMCQHSGCRTNQMGERVCCCKGNHCNIDLRGSTSGLLFFTSFIVLLSATCL